MNKRICIALVGEPNAGKSTLLNNIIGEKISIVTPKVQTTRKNLRGIVHHGDVEMIFVDTPGIFKPQGLLERSITRTAWQGADEADLVCLLIDARQNELSTNQLAIMQGLNKREKHVIAAINKIDLVEKPRLLKLAKTLHDELKIVDIFMISAKKKRGIEELVKFLTMQSYEAPWSFTEDDLTDTPIKELAEEITREKLFMRLNRELPYSLKVQTDSWEESINSIKIHQSVYVLRESQKKIVIGDNAANIKEIGQSSRTSISRLTGKDVHLFLHVKVRDNWIEDDVDLPPIKLK
jgi:GTP-binding protein Era